MNNAFINIRDVIRNSKEVFGQVKDTGQPVIVVSRKEPQVAIVSLKDLTELERARQRSSAKALLAWSKKMRTLLKDEELPSDLSTNHDYYLWEDNASKPE